MKIYLVGGAVRDKLLGLPVKEQDWVVVGATVKDMLEMGYKQVGKEFPVFLHPKTSEEYALARMERKVKPGYKGFTFDTSPEVSLEDDLIRRDLTINAMAENIETHEMIDPYGGRKDIKAKKLRHVSPAFAEDPVRILRVGRFLARYTHMGFKVAPETYALMQQMVRAGEVDALVAERVWKELERALGEKHPEQFFAVLNQCGALPILFPSLHFDGDGMKALKSAVKLTGNYLVRFAALLHALHDPKKSIIALCNRYRVPNAFRELAILVALHHEEALNYSHRPRKESNAHIIDSAEALTKLFATLDIYRREERFEDFLTACQAIANSRGFDFDREHLLECAQAAKSVDVQAIIAEGHQGAELALQLKQERKEKIAAWLKQ